MIVFGILSSVFDYLTFAVLIKFFHASEHTFQTGWFLESVVSATLIVLVVRTRNLFYKSKPGKYLFIVTLLMVGFVLILPLLPFAYSMGFVALPLTFYAAMLLIVMLYLISAEISKRYFFKYAMK